MIDYEREKEMSDKGFMRQAVGYYIRLDTSNLPKFKPEQFSHETEWADMLIIIDEERTEMTYEEFIEMVAEHKKTKDEQCQKK